MGLDLNKLEKVVELAGGAVRARCPACAEGGQDRKGEHLRVYPDGKFGCCVFPGDVEHRKRIFALAGERGRHGIKVRAPAARAGGEVQRGILGRLGRAFPSTTTIPQSSDGSDGSNEVEAPLADTRTPRTPDPKSSGDSNESIDLPLEKSRTLRTPFQNPRVYVEKVPSEEGEQVCKLKGFGRGVRSVRADGAVVEPPLEFQERVRGVRMPYFTPSRTLVIPFSSPARFHWWSGGQAVAETRAEVQLWAGGTRADPAPTMQRSSEESGRQPEGDL